MSLGVALKPEQIEAIVTIGLFIIGSINMAKNK